MSDPKVFLVTGASSGIGRSAAELLLAAGHVVYVAARRTERLEVLANPKDRDSKAGAKPLAMDVTKDDEMLAGVNAIITAEGRIDGLVNNAGYGEYGSVEETPIDAARYQFEVNVFGLARLTQLVLPYMRHQGAGRIVNVSSIGGKIGEPHGAWYHATKFAVEGFSDSLRMEVAQFGIDVSVIQPGAIKTEWNGIAGEKLLERSGDGPYGDMARKHAAFFEQTYASGQASEPAVVGRAIVHALTAASPKTRYAVGGGATPILAARSLLSDRLFDKLMLTSIKRAK